MPLNTHINPNYTLGRGKVYFARFISGRTPGPFRYIGNTPEFNLTIESETLDHFSSERGTREKDDSVLLEVTRTGSLICDDINAKNVALFFFGSTASLTQVKAVNQTEDFENVNQEDILQIGLTSNDYIGTRGLSKIVVTNPTDKKPYILYTDYTVDADRGMIAITKGGNIINGSKITVNFNIDAATSTRILSGTKPVEGAMRFIEDNPKGENRDIFLPYVKISPNGDLTLKGDEWRQIPFNIEIWNSPSGEAIYIDGQPIRS